jgi:hypothetical protein
MYLDIIKKLEYYNEYYYKKVTETNKNILSSPDYVKYASHNIVLKRLYLLK